VAELRKRCEGVPPEYFVVLVGDMITEEALPTYMAMLNTLDGVRDETGSDPTPWGRWTRCAAHGIVVVGKRRGSRRERVSDETSSDPTPGPLDQVR
jgi:hypothetical protein